MAKGTRFHQGKFSPMNTSKYDGDPTNIFYRSSWELKFFIWCDNNPDIVKYSSEEVVIAYLCPTDNKMHRYFVDARIQVRNTKNELKTYLVEIKPDKETRPPVIKSRKTKSYITEVTTWLKNEAKWNAARQWCVDRNIEFVILTEYELGLAKRK